MVQPRVSRKSVDIVLKYTADALGGALFARFGLPFPPIVAGLPSELPQLLISSQQTDLIFRLADGSILHLEFQTTRRSGDILRFAAYHLAVYERYKRPVHTVVLYGAGIRSAADTLDTGALTFRVHNIFLGREDGDATLRRLHEKVARDEPFTETDRIDIILAPLMRRRRPIAVVARDAALLTAHLPQAQREMTVGALLGLSYPDISDEVAIAILGELGMTTLAQALEARGEVKGKLEGKREALRMVLRARFDALPGDVERRIDTVEGEELNRLLARASVIENLAAL
jgi:predicted transposase YdaD